MILQRDVLEHRDGQSDIILLFIILSVLFKMNWIPRGYITQPPCGQNSKMKMKL